jgi:hypothetical protein
MNPVSTVQVQAGTECVETESANRVLADYYRCPVNSVRFRATGQSERQPGCFRLGPDAICYGRLSSGGTASSPLGDLDDAFDHIRAESNGVGLPFDVQEVIENLRREPYTAHFHSDLQLGRLKKVVGLRWDLRWT